MSENQQLKLLVIGIDGASFTVFDRLIKKGILPNFEKLKKQSSFGPLQATFPPHTAPGWPSMFNGVEPGEHGIYQFWSTKVDDYEPVSMNASDSTREPTWHVLERFGYKVGVYNVPMTHPPTDLKDGYMISWPLSTTLRYTSPPGLMRELMKENLHYHSDIVTMYRGQKDYSEQASVFMDGRTKTCKYLQATHPVDALFVVYTEVDRVSHYYWGENEEPSAAVEQCYQEMDESLGHLLELANEQTLVIVSSDHGFGLCESDFNVHELLEQHGLLSTKYVPTSSDDKEVQDDASLHPWFESTINYKRVIDWDNTYFYMPTPGCFGLNMNLKGREKSGCLNESEIGHYFSMLQQAISSYKDENDESLFQVVRSSEIYKGISVDQAPDFILLPKTFSVMPTPSLTGSITSKPSQSGVHYPDGALFVSGSTFPKDSQLFARIEDVHPLILAHLNVPVPQPIDGHWLVEPPFEVKREAYHENTHGRSLNDEESRFLNKQLKEIGYL